MSNHQEAVNPRTGKIERVFVNLEAVYPNPDDLNEEYSFEELRARHRGWLDKKWSREKPVSSTEAPSQAPNASSPLPTSENSTQNVSASIASELSPQDGTTEVIGDHTLSDILGTKDAPKSAKTQRGRRKKVMEVKAETQTGTPLSTEQHFSLLTWLQ